MAVVAMPGQLEALPEIHHVDQVFQRVLRPEQAKDDQPFAAEQIEAWSAQPIDGFWTLTPVLRARSPISSADMRDSILRSSEG